MNKQKTFNITVTILVTIIAVIFGILAGFCYFSSDINYFSLVISGTFGLISGILVAKLYLKTLAFFADRQYGKIIVWLAGSITAGLCGILSTAFIHSMTIAVHVIFTQETFASLTDQDGFFTITIIIAHAIGLLVGLLTGSICSAFYAVRIAGTTQKFLTKAADTVKSDYGRVE